VTRRGRVIIVYILVSTGSFFRFPNRSSAPPPPQALAALHYSLNTARMPFHGYHSYVSHQKAEYHTVIVSYPESHVLLAKNDTKKSQRRRRAVGTYTAYISRINICLCAFFLSFDPLSYLPVLPPAAYFESTFLLFCCLLLLGFSERVFYPGRAPFNPALFHLVISHLDLNLPTVMISQ
jgi:hypothetical protein